MDKFDSYWSDALIAINIALRWFKILLFSGIWQSWKSLYGNTDSPRFRTGCLVTIWGYDHLRKETYKVDLKFWWSSPFCSHMIKLQVLSNMDVFTAVCNIPCLYFMMVLPKTRTCFWILAQSPSQQTIGLFNYHSIKDHGIHLKAAEKNCHKTLLIIWLTHFIVICWRLLV